MRSGVTYDGAEKGATLLEATVVLPLFLLLLITSFDLLRLSYDVLTLRYVTSTIMRRVVIGDMTSSQIEQELLRGAKVFGTELKSQDISLCQLSAYPCSPGISAPFPGELMILEVRAAPRGLVMLGAGKLGLKREVFSVAFRVIGKIES